VESFRSGIRKVRFRFELYDNKGNFKKDLNNIMSFKIDHNYFAQVKTTAKLSMIEDSSIDYANDIIRPYISISVPSEAYVKPEKELTFLNMVHPIETEIIVPGEYSEWDEYPLGAFYLSSPTRRDTQRHVIRDIEAYDLTLLLSEDKLTERFVLRKGENYVLKVEGILKDLGVTRYHIMSPEVVTIRRDIEYEPGTSILTVINDMLGQIGNTPLYMDNNGVLISKPYINPNERLPTKIYDNSVSDLTLVGASEELDIFNVPNVFSVTISNPDEKPITKTVVNDDPTNPLSTVRRGRRIVDFRTIEDMSSEESLEKYAMRIANESNTQYGTIQFKTPLMLGHWYGEVVSFDYPRLDLSGNFLETGWSMDLRVGGEMTHILRKVVNFTPERVVRND